MNPLTPRSTSFPYPTLFRSDFLQRRLLRDVGIAEVAAQQPGDPLHVLEIDRLIEAELALDLELVLRIDHSGGAEQDRSEEHTSELQSRLHLVFRLLLGQIT